MNTLHQSLSPSSNSSAIHLFLNSCFDSSCGIDLLSSVYLLQALQQQCLAVLKSLNRPLGFLLAGLELNTLQGGVFGSQVLHSCVMCLNSQCHMCRWPTLRGSNVTTLVLLHNTEEALDNLSARHAFIMYVNVLACRACPRHPPPACDVKHECVPV